MNGINYIINDCGEKVAVMLDLIEYGNIWEEIYTKLSLSNKNESDEVKLENRKNDFFNFINHHSYKLPLDYKFNRDELHER